MNNNIEKRSYQTPELEIIKLDNEISLILASGGAPPIGPGEGTTLEQIFQSEEQSKSIWE